MHVCYFLSLAWICIQGLNADGLISGGDMTFEAGMTKLIYLIGRFPIDEIKKVSFVEYS